MVTAASRVAVRRDSAPGGAGALHARTLVAADVEAGDLRVAPAPEGALR